MPSINYVLVYCTACGAVRKIAPEKAMELQKLGDFEWPHLRTLKCPITTCTGTMKRAPEYGEPLFPSQGF